MLGLLLQLFILKSVHVNLFAISMLKLFLGAFLCCRCWDNLWLDWLRFVFNLFFNYCNWLSNWHILPLLFNRFRFGCCWFDLTVELCLFWADTSGKIYRYLALDLLGLGWTQGYLIFNHISWRTFCQLWSFTQWLDASQRSFLCLLPCSGNLFLWGQNL